MKHPTKAPIVCLFAFALCAILFAEEAPWVAPVRAAKKKNPVPAEDASLSRGKALYAQECASCHGPAGKGDGPGAKDLEKKPGDLSSPKLWEQSDGALFWKISEGRKPMPSLAEKWTEEQRWDTVNYVRTFAPKNQTPTSTATKP